MTLRCWPGRPYPLGATYDGTGTNFSLFSEVAEQVELCLFDVGSADEDAGEVRIPMPEVTGQVWHAFLPDVGPGQRYGFRVHGPYDPSSGQRCNPAKLLMDPYAKAVDGDLDWHESVFGYRFDDPDGDPSELDSAGHVPRAVVTSSLFDWRGDRLLQTPMEDSVIYEVHVKGFTAQHPEIPERLRGTYAGLAHPASIDHLRRLGVTAVELMPVHHFVSEHHLVEAGLSNYWGYNTLAYFAPHRGYASEGAEQVVGEFKAMVRALHAAGIEVILDVVYNHTAEGNHLGPTLSWRGIDNPTYYRLVEDDPRHYMDYTGTGNSLNMRSPSVIRMIMDSLRYWVTEMHVDGFRFDLAATLARELHDVDRLSTFFEVVQQDPVISQVKLIAEPWDVGEGGYQVGNFPPLWSEWNGMYRDTMRDYWRGDPAHPGRVRIAADRLQRPVRVRHPPALGQHQLRHRPRRVHAARPGVLQRQAQRGQRRGQPGRDRRQPVLEPRGRGRDRRPGGAGRCAPASSATCSRRCCCPRACRCCSAATSSAGPRAATTTATAQDNPISWFDWDDVDEDLLEVARWLIALRAEHPVFRRRQVVPGPRHPRGGRARHRVDGPRRHRHGRRRLGGRSLGPAGVPQRRQGS